MIEFYSETDFSLGREKEVRNWIQEVILKEGLETGELIYVFCDDEYLLKLNKDFLDHDTYTDIISFDYRMGDQLNGEIYISIDRIKENATLFKTDFISELHRVMIHGILHFCGYKDKTEKEASEMRKREDKALLLRTFDLQP
jgi:probable rRNA maturation factor